MIRVQAKRFFSKGFVWLALALAVMIPFAAFAQSDTGSTAADATSHATVSTQMQGNGGRGQFGVIFGGGSMDTSSLTDEQKSTYDQAVALYEAVEDQVLADLVSEGVVTQTDADAYTALRSAKKSLASLDMSAWTAEQYKAYYEATQKTGDERTQAMQALADAGQITQAQADALSVQDQNDLWNTISQNASTNSAIQTALNTMRQAYQTYQETLRTAGIAFSGKDGTRGDVQSGQNNQSGTDGGNRPSAPNGNRKSEPNGSI